MDNILKQIRVVHSYSQETPDGSKENLAGNAYNNIEEPMTQCNIENVECAEESFGAAESNCLTEKIFQSENNTETNQTNIHLEPQVFNVYKLENTENIYCIDNVKNEYTITELQVSPYENGESYFQPLTYQDLNLIYSEDSSLHVCDVCEKRFRKKSNLKRHYRSHTGDNPHACNQCNACFPTMSRLKEHLHAHTGLRPYVCNYCEKTFSRVSNLTRHIRTHNSEKPFQCDKCDSRFVELTRLREHYMTHGGEKRFACDVCDKRFLKKYNLKRHLHTHTGVHLHSCEVCGRGFSKKIYLLLHMETHATSIQTENASTLDLDAEALSAIETVASNCVVECTNPDDSIDTSLYSDNNVIPLEEAKIIVQSAQKDKLFSCGLCSRHYLKESSLLAHLQRHEKNPLTCKVCNATYTHASRLKDHLLTHTGEKAYACVVCDRSFGRNSNLLRHLQTHTGEKRFRCEVCKKRFSSGRSLKEHVLSHSGDKPHQCHICIKLFRHKFGLQRHLLTHTGERPHKCEFCGEQFSRKGRLILHRNKYHKPDDLKLQNRVEPRLMNIIQNLEARLCESIEDSSHAYPVRSKSSKKNDKMLEAPEELDEGSLNQDDPDISSRQRRRSHRKSSKKTSTKPKDNSCQATYKKTKVMQNKKQKSKKIKKYKMKEK